MKCGSAAPPLIFHSGVRLAARNAAFRYGHPKAQSGWRRVGRDRRDLGGVWYTFSLWQQRSPRGIIITTMPTSGERCPEIQTNRKGRPPRGALWARRAFLLQFP